MKKAKKVIALTLCAVMLVVGSVAGTLAYLQDTATVTNTFTVGSVDITLDEAKVTEYGKVEGNTRVTANEYKLVPGHLYVKDPTIHVTAGSEECWLFVEVENGLAGIEAATTIADQMIANGWTNFEGTNVYAYKESVDAREAAVDKVVFENFTLNGTANVSEYDGKTIEVTAYAVQKDTFDTAKAAWDATYGATNA